VNIQTVQFPHILETRDLAALNDFLSHTAFVISHKSESTETLLRVLWYIPVNSTIIIVTNCQGGEQEQLADALRTRLADHQHTYLVHQKDPQIARAFKKAGVPQILGRDGKVRNGKGEGMYIGALAAQQLGYVRWVIFYDADNFVPSALLEYTFAMCRLFTSLPQPAHFSANHTHKEPSALPRNSAHDLHNVRICWSSKPDMKNLNLETRIMGRTSKVVSPLFDSLLETWFGIQNHPISSSNAGEQGMTLRTATTLRFSSGFSVETFHLIDLLFHAVKEQNGPGEVVFQQYLSKSPHFHEKKGDRHIKKMIAESLGCFFHFEEALPPGVKAHLQQIYDELQLERVIPIVYPPLQDLPPEPFAGMMKAFALFPHAALSQPTSEVDPPELVPTEISYHQFLLTDIGPHDLVTADTSNQSLLTLDVPAPQFLLADVNCQNALANDVLMAD
jgi:mannosyl-3-phosphoglycerate synthase